MVRWGILLVIDSNWIGTNIIRSHASGISLDLVIMSPLENVGTGEGIICICAVREIATAVQLW